MRLTRAGEYAVRCTLYLSKQEQGEVVSRKEIAEAMEVPDSPGRSARSHYTLLTSA
jgi:DNA-binding IscR family transcriptional regulator